MKDSYLAIGVIILVAILAFAFDNRKTEAPTKQNDLNNNNISLSDGSYNLDTSSSVLSWQGEYITGLSERGTVGFKSGIVEVSQGMITGGEFIIDMDSIESIPSIDRLVSHLKSDDFFAVESYPTAKFVLKTAASSSEEGAKIGRYVIGGNLIVKNIDKPISFIATVVGNEDAISATASFAINRADWDIKYNSPTFFKNLGDKIIRDAIIIELDLKGLKVIE